LLFFGLKWCIIQEYELEEISFWDRFFNCDFVGFLDLYPDKY
jgi:hypothetical protein